MSAPLPREQVDAIRAVVRRYARPLRSRGRVMPMHCKPATDPQTGLQRDGKGSAGKVIYPGRAEAVAAAAEIGAITGDVLYVYECPRSRSGHHHITSRR